MRFTSFDVPLRTPPLKVSSKNSAAMYAARSAGKGDENAGRAMKKSLLKVSRIPLVISSLMVGMFSTISDMLATTPRSRYVTSRDKSFDFGPLGCCICGVASTMGTLQPLIFTILGMPTK